MDYVNIVNILNLNGIKVGQSHTASKKNIFYVSSRQLALTEELLRRRYIGITISLPLRSPEPTRGTQALCRVGHGKPPGHQREGLCHQINHTPLVQAAEVGGPLEDVD
jgi:hypothetical protein